MDVRAWRGSSTQGLPHARELIRQQHLTTIEINGTFYRTQTPATFAKWAKETPDGFVFSVKGPRYAVNRRVLAEAGDSIKRFFNSGVLELGDKLGPMLWQFAPTKKFDAADFGAFLELLPAKLDGRKLRHVVEVRHDSFCVPGVHRAGAQVRRRRWCSPSTTSIRRSPIRSAISSTRGCRRATTRSPPPIRRRRSTPGPSAPSLWAKGAVPEGLPLADPHKTGQESPARRVRLLHPRSQGARPRRRHGADRAAGVGRRAQQGDSRIAPSAGQQDRRLVRCDRSDTPPGIHDRLCCKCE